MNGSSKMRSLTVLKCLHFWRSTNFKSSKMKSFIGVKCNFSWLVQSGTPFSKKGEREHRFFKTQIWNEKKKLGCNFFWKWILFFICTGQRFQNWGKKLGSRKMFFFIFKKKFQRWSLAFVGMMYWRIYLVTSGHARLFWLKKRWMICVKKMHIYGEQSQNLG